MDVGIQVDKIRKTNERSRSRLSSIVIKTDDGFGLEATEGRPPVFIKRLMQSGDVQVFSATIPAGTTIKRHSHRASAELIVVTAGAMGVEGRRYNPGECATIPADTQHAPCALEGECRIIVMVMPPEKEYEP